LGYVPVIALSASNLEKYTGFNWTVKDFHVLLMSLVYGDILMKCLYRTRLYELVPGSVNELYEKLNALCIKQFHYDSFAGYNKMVN
jgi:predicted nucleotide-binding protein (sugar kinase/HSP70/actin superfamily)